ncbi:MAG: tetratricopeptide repeat protein [Bryobacterales bacterium]|nr:tetratricopeptide repeat protein [Bryobacterales bacterium]
MHRDVLLLLLLLAWQVICCTAIGESFLRIAAKLSPWRGRIPEISLLMGYAIYGLLGYALMAAAGSARLIAPVLLTLCICGLWVSRRTVFGELPDVCASYVAFRGTRWGVASLVVISVLCLLVGFYRSLWLVGAEGAAGVIVGTHIFPDEVRTLGIPISLAAHGFPMLFPFSTATIDSYPLAAFLFSAAHIAWLPSKVLPILIADSMAATLFYGLVALVGAVFVTPSYVARFLTAASAVFSVSYNLWNLAPNPAQPWFRLFFGYYEISQLYSTIGWTPLSGLTWVMNHALCFTSALGAMVWFAAFPGRKLRAAWVPCLVLACFCGATGIDMAVMCIATGGVIVGWKWMAAKIRRDPAPAWFWAAVGILACATVSFCLANFPSLAGRTSPQYFNPFQLTASAWSNLGIMLSHAGPYLLLMLVALVLTRVRTGVDAAWWVAVTAALVISFVFVWHSIWVWRVSLTVHVLFGVICAACAGSLPPRTRTAFLAAWAVFLLPGVAQTRWTAGLASNSWKPPAYAEAVHWIYANTPLNARVVEFRPAELSLIPDMAFLRTGNQAGLQVSPSHHPMVGYESYRSRFSNLGVGIANNDYVLAPVADTITSVLNDCGAEEIFRNSSYFLRKISSRCREMLQTPEGMERAADFLRGRLAQKRRMEATQRIAELRPKLEKDYWGKGRCPEAVRLLEPLIEQTPENAEGHYSLAYSLHCTHKDPRRAIREYSKALELGYGEFFVLFHRGILHYEQRDMENARRDLWRALDLQPGNVGLQTMLRDPALARATR